jgi:hypothetical protein
MPLQEQHLRIMKNDMAAVAGLAAIQEKEALARELEVALEKAVAVPAKVSALEVMTNVADAAVASEAVAALALVVMVSALAAVKAEARVHAPCLNRTEWFLTSLLHFPFLPFFNSVGAS